MHELALAEGILAVVLDAADEQRVRRVRLRVGSLQAVVPDSLEFSFQLLAADTPACDARLEIKQVRARVRCSRCGSKSPLDVSFLNCRNCGASDIQILSGDELVVDGVEMERGWRFRPRPATPTVSRNHLLDHAIHDAVLMDSVEPPWLR
ncbi:MAG: hydrogenase maturation nickel metallochaperone HypA [Dehalococcoidia bacterium]